MEYELQIQLERKVVREMKREQAAAKAAANKAAEDQDKAAHEVVLAAHIGQETMATTLAAGATNEEAFAA